MTFREKLLQEQPQMVDEGFQGGCSGCPKDYGYENHIVCHMSGDDCEACWDREMPGTENE